MFPSFSPATCALLPAALMLASALPWRESRAWRSFLLLSWLALGATVVRLAWQLALGQAAPEIRWLRLDTAGAWLAVLVQCLGLVIGAFSSRYLQGEKAQDRYRAALGAVLAAVHVLVLADHWLVLIAAWAAVGPALERLLCFYRQRPFALLAAHKKRVVDRLADVMLIAAGTLAWLDVGSGRLSDLLDHVQARGASPSLQASAILLSLAVVLRSALLPMHGWLIQVMEAPTPVSALMHAGVVNLGGFVLVRLATFVQASRAACWLLVAAGLSTAVLAGLVMLTRVSIKVRLAWSTVAQMGFMVMECGLGLHTMALMHLIGHSLYKAHAFLGASEAVDVARVRRMRGSSAPSARSIVVAPFLAWCLLASLSAAARTVSSELAWPWWWSGVLAFAWAPMLWLPERQHPMRDDAPLATGMVMMAAIALAALIGHALPLGLHDTPSLPAGLVALSGMGALYLWLAFLHVVPAWMTAWRRWSYAGFYLDEYATRFALYLWPARWTPTAP